MATEPTDTIHAALIHAAATLTAAKKDVMEKASPDEVKKHFKTFLHTLEQAGASMKQAITTIPDRV